jgi:hypothetical protein
LSHSAFILPVLFCTSCPGLYIYMYIYIYSIYIVYNA